MEIENMSEKEIISFLTKRSKTDNERIAELRKTLLLNFGNPKKAPYILKTEEQRKSSVFSLVLMILDWFINRYRKLEEGFLDDGVTVIKKSDAFAFYDWLFENYFKGGDHWYKRKPKVTDFHDKGFTLEQLYIKWSDPKTGV